MTSEIQSPWCRLVIMYSIKLISLYFHIHVFTNIFGLSNYHANLMKSNNTEEEKNVYIYICTQKNYSFNMCVWHTKKLFVFFFSVFFIIDFLNKINNRSF